MKGPSVPLPFDFSLRTRIVSGRGVVTRAGELARELGAASAFVVTDPGLVAAGHLDRVTASLGDAGVRCAVFDRVRENPTTRDVADCLEVARGHPVDLFVALGGGSSIDAAKGCNFLLSNGGEMEAYRGMGKASIPLLPMIAIPTTTGTGSEMQSYALIADERTHEKMACGDPTACPRVAILDPTLAVSQPRVVAACSGLDALAHAVETAVTRPRTVVSSLLSREAFRLVRGNLRRVLDDPGDLEGQSNMLLAATAAGLAIEHSMLGAAHSMANPLTARFGLVHGQAVGLMLPHVVRFNAGEPLARRAYEELAVAAGVVADGSAGPGVDRLVACLDDLLSVTGLPRSLSACDVPRSAIEPMAGEASQQWTARFNPRRVTQDDFRAMYEKAFEADP